MATAIGSIGLGASLAGGLLSAFGASRSGAAQQQMYDYQAQVAKLNSQIDQQNADYALQVGEQQALNYGIKAGQQFGQIRTAEAASGLDVNSGSAADVQASQRKIAAMDTNTIRTNAAKTAYDFRVQSANDLNQAGLYTMAGANAKTAGDINALGSLIGTAGSVSSKWLQGNTIGLWNSTSSSVGYSGGMGLSTGATGGLY